MPRRPAGTSGGGASVARGMHPSCDGREGSNVDVVGGGGRSHRPRRRDSRQRDDRHPARTRGRAPARRAVGLVLVPPSRSLVTAAKGGNASEVASPAHRRRRLRFLCESQDEMERPRASHSSVDRRLRRDRGFAQDRRLDRSCATTLERGSRLEGRVGCGCVLDQLAWRGADRVFRVGPTQVGLRRFLAAGVALG